MSLFSAQAGLSFPASLSEKYRPHSLQDFVGLEKPKKVIAKFADSPFPNAAFLFVGPSPGFVQVMVEKDLRQGQVRADEA
jgi:hypothetical protein